MNVERLKDAREEGGQWSGALLRCFLLFVVADSELFISHFSVVFLFSAFW